jgi:hypothetical protein
MRVHFRDDQTIVIDQQPVCRAGTFLAADHASVTHLPHAVLEHAVYRFNWKPITLGHDAKQVLGSTMGNATYRDGVIYQDLLLWDPAFIRERATRMSPGGFKYRHVDGDICEITDVNHIALVRENRMGADVAIGAN